MLARASVYEGDATLLMTQWAAANLTQEELLEVIAGGNDPEVQAVLDRTPAILRDTLTFPYTTGFGFVHAHPDRGWLARGRRAASRRCRSRPSRSSTPTSTPPARRRSR